jgi:hypothetical protein
MNCLPGWFPGGAAAAASYTPASMVLNGTDEVLTRTLSTSGASTTIFTFSFWLKTAVSASDLFFLISTNAGLTSFLRIVGNTSQRMAIDNVVSSSFTWAETADTAIVVDDTWHHYVIQVDTTQGTADNRVRIYRDGVQLTDATQVSIGASEANVLFDNGNTMQLGNLSLSTGNYDAKRLAFVELLEGVSQPASAFGFDDGGTWTRKKYTGSYGTYGFLLDGSTGVLGADLSGNGQTFTGTNMDASNLDTGDLPPYTN